MLLLQTGCRQRDGSSVFIHVLLNDAGNIAKNCWKAIPNHIPDVVLRNNVIMPNRVHGIIEITKPTIHAVGVENFQPLRTDGSTPSNVNCTQHEYQHVIPRSIGSIVRGFKIGVTKDAAFGVPRMRTTATLQTRDGSSVIMTEEPSLCLVTRTSDSGAFFGYL